MSENDYIAEYIKEKHPELISGMDFALWRIGRTISHLCEQVTDAVRQYIKSDTEGEKY